MAQIQMAPGASEYYLQGYTVLRACIEEAQAILEAPFNPGAAPTNPEAQKTQLREYVRLSVPTPKYASNIS